MHGAPDGATEMHGFAALSRIGTTIAVQAWRLDLETDELTIQTTFVELSSGAILGKDDSLPRILAVAEDRIAVAEEEPVPAVVVFAFDPSGGHGAQEQN